MREANSPLLLAPAKSLNPSSPNDVKSTAHMPSGDRHTRILDATQAQAHGTSDAVTRLVDNLAELINRTPRLTQVSGATPPH